MLLIFFQFILYTDQSFSGIFSVGVTILGWRYSHFLLKYFTESKNGSRICRLDLGATGLPISAEDASNGFSAEFKNVTVMGK